MPKKASKPSAKTETKTKPKSVERREAAQKEPKVKTYSAAEARAANDNGTIQDRVIVALSYPSDHVPMVGFGAFVRGQFFVRQTEIPSSDEAAEKIGQKQYDDLVAFLKTVKDEDEEEDDDNA